MSFDPYRKWLGIPSKRRPPTYYELLGITPGERDSDVIRSAIDQRRMYILSKKGEGQDVHVKEILGLIEEATSTLLVPEFKHGYDRQLGLHIKKRGARRSYILPSWMESRVAHVYGGGSGIVGDILGIVTILLIAFGLMAWWSFTLQKLELTGNKSDEMTWMEKIVLGDAPKQNDIPVEQAIEAATVNELPLPTKPTEGDSTTKSSGDDLEQWLATVSRFRADLQIDEVRKKLVELNPGFDGKLATKISDGKVLELSFLTDHVSKISPLRALQHLEILKMKGTPGEPSNGKLSDISALKGMQLKLLDLCWNDIADISAVSGMPLVHLEIGMSKKINSLSPLKGMSLETLNCSNTSVSDLSPLKGMPLSVLVIRKTQVTDFSLLKEFPLRNLDIRSTSILDLSILSGKSLDTLWCGDTNVSSIEPLKGMPITFLDLSSTKVRDLTQVKSLQLKTLYLDNAAVTDLTPLNALKLEGLSFSPNRIEAGLEVVRSMQSIREISDTWVSLEKPESFWKRFGGLNSKAAVAEVASVDLMEKSVKLPSKPKEGYYFGVNHNETDNKKEGVRLVFCGDVALFVTNDKSAFECAILWIRKRDHELEKRGYIVYERPTPPNDIFVIFDCDESAFKARYMYESDDRQAVVFDSPKLAKGVTGTFTCDWKSADVVVGNINGKPTSTAFDKVWRDLLVKHAPTCLMYPKNFVKNGDFEEDKKAVEKAVQWYTWPEKALAFDKTIASDNGFCLNHSAPTDYSVVTLQRVNLPNGMYRLTFNVVCSGGQSEASAIVRGFGGPDKKIENFGKRMTAKRFFIDNINLTTGTCEILFSSNAKANQWLNIDDVVLEAIPPSVNEMPLPAKSTENDPVEEIRKSIAKAEKTYTTELVKAQADVITWLETREATARKKGNNSTVNLIKIQREKLETEGAIPKSVPVEISRRVDTARDMLDASYASLLKEVLTAKLDDLANEIQAKRVQLAEEKPEVIFRNVSRFARNMVVNGSFEFPEITRNTPPRTAQLTVLGSGWQDTVEKSTSVVRYLAAIPVHGDQMLNLSPRLVTQEVSGFIPGERYVLTCYVATFAGPGVPEVSIDVVTSVAGEKVLTTVTASNAGTKHGYSMPGESQAKWQQVTLLFKALGETHELGLAAPNAGNHHAVVDQVSILPYLDN